LTYILDATRYTTLAIIAPSYRGGKRKSPAPRRGK